MTIFVRLASFDPSSRTLAKVAPRDSCKKKSKSSQIPIDYDFRVVPLIITSYEGSHGEHRPNPDARRRASCSLDP